MVRVLNRPLIFFFTVLYFVIKDVFRDTILSTLDNINSKTLESTDSYLTQTPLFGSLWFYSETNTLVLNENNDYILSIERFEEPLL